MLNCDEELKQELILKGYAVRPFLDASEVSELLRLHDSSKDNYPAVDYFATPFSQDNNYRQNVRNDIGSIIEPRLKRILPDQRLAAAGYVAKSANGQAGKVGLHRDFTLVDPSSHISIHAWCPLTDVNETNGCLRVVPGSHKWPHISALGFNPTPWDKHIATLEGEYSQPIAMKAGDVILYDQRVLHYSEPNLSNERRIATLSIMLPEKEPMRVYNFKHTSPTQITVFAGSDQFLTQFNPMEIITDPAASGLKEVCFMSFHPDVYSLEELESLSGFGPIATTTDNFASSAV